MIRRYYIAKEAYEGETFPAIETLASDRIITNEVLEFKHLPYVCILLDDNEVEILKSAGFDVKEELISDNAALAGDYEFYRSLFYYKPHRRKFTGRGVKVAVLDSGCNQLDTSLPETRRVPFQYAYNFIDSNVNVRDNLGGGFGHGTQVASIIVNSTNSGGGNLTFMQGVAPGVELHILKVLSDSGSLNTTAALAALDYCIDNSIDFINCSWQGGNSVLDEAIYLVQEAGGVVVAASGNSTINAATVYPACVHKVVAVNSVTEQGTVHHKSWIAPGGGDPPYHGVNVACNGYLSSVRYATGNFGNSNATGTSYSAPFFTGVLAVYKEQLGIADNYRVLDYVLSRARKSHPEFGSGIATF